MPAFDERANPVGRVLDHIVDVAFALVAAGWLVYILRITGELSFWADDLRLVEQGGSWSGLFEPYNGHMSLAILALYRGASELFGLSYAPIMAIGALSLLAVPVCYFLTARRTLGPPLAALLCVALLWYDGMSLRPASLNHYLALLGAMAAAEALNRGRRADGILAAGVAFALISAGGGLVVVGACLVHNLLVRPPVRRWLAVLGPAAIWIAWWALIADTESVTAKDPLSVAETARVVRDLCLAPFYDVGFGHWPLAAVLLCTFLLHGFVQLRRGLAEGASFVAWSAAMVMWALALARSRGILADPHTFRYAYLSLGFALLAIVPRHPIQWPPPVRNTDRPWLAVASVLVVGFAGLSALTVREGFQESARSDAERGREAEGTMLVLDLGPGVIPDATPIPFYGFFGPHGSARQVRSMTARYGSPFTTTLATIDQELVDRGIVRARFAGRRPHPGCQAIAGPLKDPGIETRGMGAAPKGTGAAVAAARPAPRQLWSAEPFTIDVRRYGEDWIPLANVRAGRNMVLTLPYLSSDVPWEIRANGACDITPEATGS